MPPITAVISGGMQHSRNGSARVAVHRPFVILNPVASRGRVLRVWPTLRPVLQQAGLQWDEAVAERPLHAWTLAEEAASRGHDLIVAVGGDGTVHEVINGLLRGQPSQPPALAIIPLGTANDFARALSLPLDPVTAAGIVLKGSARRVDLGQMNDRYYATISGVGFDAEVAALVNRWPRWVRGFPIYVAGILKTLASYRPVEARITIDGVSVTERILLLAAGNTCWYGGGFAMCPHAGFDDGLLAVIYAKDLGTLETLALLPKVFSGKHLLHPKVVHMSARSVHVESAVPLAVHADGESVGHVPATFRIVPNALEVLVSPSA